MAVGFFEVVINVVEWYYFEGMRVRNVFLQYYPQVLFMLKCRVQGILEQKKSGINKRSSLNSSIDKIIKGVILKKKTYVSTFLPRVDTPIDKFKNSQLSSLYNF